MQTFGELTGHLAHLQSVLARTERSTAETRPGGEGLPDPETWRGLYSPAQDMSPAERQHLLPPVRPGSVSSLVRRLSKTALGLGIVAVVGFAPLQRLHGARSGDRTRTARGWLFVHVFGDIIAQHFRALIGFPLGHLQ